MSDSVARKLFVELEQFIKAPPERVWEFVGTEQGMKDWLGPKTFTPIVGSPVFFDVNHEGGHYHMTGEVLVVDPPHEIAFTWLEQEVGGEPWPVATTLRVRLTPVEGGTRVTLRHEGFERLPEKLAIEQHQGYVQGWQMLNDLPRLAARIEGRSIEES